MIENAQELVKRVLSDAKSESTLARVASKWQEMAGMEAHLALHPVVALP